MKNLKLVLFLFIPALGFSSNGILREASVAVQDNHYVLLAAGTPVFLSVNEEVVIDEVQIGHSIEFTVRHNVVVNGKTVILAGSTAFGMVTKLQTPCSKNYFCQGKYKLSVVVENVQSVDGKQIFLNSRQHTISVSRFNYEPATINIGTKVEAKVRDNTRVRT